MADPLAPRDYLATFLKIGVIVGLALGIAILNPELKMPALTQYVDGTGPAVERRSVPVPTKLSPSPVAPFLASRAQFFRYHAETAGL